MRSGTYISGEMSEGEYKQHKRQEEIRIKNLKDIKENLHIMKSDIQSLRDDMKLILSILNARDEIPKGWFS